MSPSRISYPDSSTGNNGLIMNNANNNAASSSQQYERQYFSQSGVLGQQQQQHQGSYSASNHASSSHKYDNANSDASASQASHMLANNVDYNAIQQQHQPCYSHYPAAAAAVAVPSPAVYSSNEIYRNLQLQQQQQQLQQYDLYSSYYTQQQQQQQQPLYYNPSNYFFNSAVSSPHNFTQHQYNPGFALNSNAPVRYNDEANLYTDNSRISQSNSFPQSVQSSLDILASLAEASSPPQQQHNNDNTMNITQQEPYTYHHEVKTSKAVKIAAATPSPPCEKVTTPMQVDAYVSTLSPVKEDDKRLIVTSSVKPTASIVTPELQKVEKTEAKKQRKQEKLNASGGNKPKVKKTELTVPKPVTALKPTAESKFASVPKSPKKAAKPKKEDVTKKVEVVERPVSPPLPPWQDVRPDWSRQSPSQYFPKMCHIHTPTLEELKSQSFSDYVQKVVLDKAMIFEVEKSDDSSACSSIDENNQSKSTSDKADEVKSGSVDKGKVKKEERGKFGCYKRVDRLVELSQGMAKVSLPIGFWEGKEIGRDFTGRGAVWEKGTPLGDMEITTPIQQNLRGISGVYEYMFTSQNAISLADFRDRADKYRREQVGSAHEDEVYTDEAAVAKLEEKFWKRLGPTMPPAWYGADQEGTLFGDDPASGWSVGQLDTCLHVLSYVPGVTSPYLYAGMWASVFCAHTEDMNLLSINYLHAGAPKIWYAIAPGPDADRFAALAEFNYNHQARKCKEFLRHKQCLMSPKVLKRAGINFTTCIQMPGDAMITFPGGYHFGFNAGFNIAEATNFGVPEWLPYGRVANICLCRPDSVRIDMNRLEFLLAKYEMDRKENPAIKSWKQWAEEKDVNKMKKLRRSMNRKESSTANKVQKNRRKVPMSEQERKKEFWVEVMTPISADERRKNKIMRQRELNAVRAKIESETNSPVEITPSPSTADPNDVSTASVSSSTVKVEMLVDGKAIADKVVSISADTSTASDAEGKDTAETLLTIQNEPSVDTATDRCFSAESQAEPALVASNNIDVNKSMDDDTDKDSAPDQVHSTATKTDSMADDSGDNKPPVDPETNIVETGKRRRKPSYKMQVLLEEVQEIKIAPKVKDAPKTSGPPRPRKKPRRRRRRMKNGPEIWHLAKPVIMRKGVVMSERVLVMLPGTELCGDLRDENDNILDYDDLDVDEDEQCFRGEVTEIADGHVRVHLDGLSKQEDVWVPISSPKLYIDGGRWEEIVEVDSNGDLPPMHYWHEMDSKRRCKE